jgi:hypothetical protein
MVLYECETWSLTLREEYRLRVFVNRVPRRIFGPKRDFSGGRVLFAKCNYNNQIEAEMGGACSTNRGEEESV